MKANYEDKIPKQTSEVAMGNLYEMNKQLMAAAPALTAEQTMEKEPTLTKWFTDHFCQQYFMLLCKEQSDYTIFNLDKTSTWHTPRTGVAEQAAADVIDCMLNRGVLLSIDLQDDGVWELWIRNREGCFAYYLFPYGNAVIAY